MYKSTLLLLAVVLTSFAFGQNTYFVESVSDDPADTLSFRYQVIQANASPGHDTIRFGIGSTVDTLFLDSTIVITEGVTIFGRNQDSTKIAGSSSLTNSGMIQMYNIGTSKFEFLHMEILAQPLDTVFGIAQDAGTTGDSLIFKHMKFTGLEYALFFDAVQNSVEISQCTFFNNTYAVNCQVNKESVEIFRCDFDSQRGAGMYVQSNYFNIHSNLFRNQQANPGMACVMLVDPVTPGLDCKFVNNTIAGNSEIGLLLNCANNNLGLVAIHNNIIYNNTSYDFKQVGTLDTAQIAKNIVGTTDPASVYFPNFYSTANPNLNLMELTATSTNAIDLADPTYAPALDYYGAAAMGSGKDIGAIEYNDPCSGLQVSFNITNVSCANTPSGYALAIPSGGTAPYTYQWTNSGVFNETTDSISGVYGDDYFIHIQDNAGCNYYDTITIVNPPNFAFNYGGMTTTPSNCGNADGSITGITVTGGTGPHSYTWWNGPDFVQNGIDLVNAVPGTAYKLRVVDSLNCGNFSTYLTVPSNDSTITINITTVDANCNQSFTGKAYANVFGGVAPYTLNWSTGESTDSILNLAAGNYYLVVQDANGCQSIQENFTINDSSAIQIATAVTPATCGSNDGTITATAVGGTAPYSYGWSQSGLSGSSLTNLYSGNYQVTVTDANGCSNNLSVWVPASGITLNTTVTSPSCYGGNDGSIDLTVTPGGAYTFLWSNGQNVEDATNLSAGFYTVTVSNGTCSQTDSISVSQPAPVGVSFSTTPASGCATADGIIVAAGTGGTGATTIELFDDNGSLGTGSTFANLEPGPYLAYVTDANGCSDSVAIGLAGTSAATPLTVAVSNIVPSACLSTTATDPGNGGASALANGGTAPYIYTWTKYLSQSGQGLGTGTVLSTTTNPTNLSAGQYILEIEDDNGCTAYSTVSIPGINLAPQEICMVTVQQDFNNNQQNVVVWEKNQGLGIDYYEIWRLEANGAWQFRDTVDFDNLSQYVDYGVDPNASYYSYQLRTVNQCGFQSVYTANHATIQLSLDTMNITPASNATSFDGSINMQWNQYAGSLSITEYKIRRTMVESGVTIQDTVIHTEPWDSATVTYTYTDNAMPAITANRSIFYQIEATFPTACTAEKAQDYNGTRSNRSAASTFGGFPLGMNEEQSNFFLVYPNPSNGEFNLETRLGGGEILVVDLFGKIVKQIDMNQAKMKIDLHELKNGTYFIRYSGNDFMETKKVIILNN